MKDLQRHGLLLLIAPMLACAASLASPQAWAQTNAELCPPAAARLTRTVVVAGAAGQSVELSAPVTSLERAAVMGAVTTGKGVQRQHAIVRVILATDHNAIAIIGK